MFVSLCLPDKLVSILYWAALWAVWGNWLADYAIDRGNLAVGLFYCIM